MGTIYLASRSPRRRELLQQVGVEFKLLDLEIDETLKMGESAADFVLRLALEKSLAGRQQLSAGTALPVLAADTSVVLDGECLGKPRDQEDAISMLMRLSGQTHQVMTGVALVGVQQQSTISVSDVTFREISLVEAKRYWQSGEPADKAGSYAIQGLGALFVETLQGSYSGVMGLPLFETAELLQAEGIELL